VLEPLFQKEREIAKENKRIARETKSPQQHAHLPLVVDGEIPAIVYGEGTINYGSNESNNFSSNVSAENSSINYSGKDTSELFGESGKSVNLMPSSSSGPNRNLSKNRNITLAKLNVDEEHETAM